MLKKWAFILGLAAIDIVHAETKTIANDFSKPAPMVVTDVQKRAFMLGMNLLSNHHYRKLSLQDVSAPAFDDYLQALDYGHIYFLQSDIDEFAPLRKDLPKAVRRGDLTTAVNVFERYRQRATDLNNWSLERLKKPFDLKKQDSVNIPDYRNRKQQLPWHKSLSEVYQYQEKRLKDALIRLRLSGKDEKQAVEKLTKRYQNLQKRLNQMTIEDVFDVYMNAISGNYDPHSNYLSPRNIEDFDIGMTLSLEGIGATLMSEDDKITINELIPGGPAYKSGKLHLKDRIIGVGQGKEGEIQDVVGMRLDKAVRLIRGKKGTFVRLLIEPSNPSEPEQEVLIERDKINLEEQAARGKIETVTENGITKKIGVIQLPSFYMDFEGAKKHQKDFRSTSRDMAKLIKEMKAKKVDGIIIDLRGDGGGSLYEAIQTVGLFIDQGPVVTVSSEDGSMNVERDTNKGALWEGPLAVMIDHQSASASEIFAAAIQDYRRGIIIGSTSFGKGTVQTVIDLNRFVSKNSPALGEMKLTISMFHRITGSSNQLQGVVPDVVLPSSSHIDDVGERSMPHALPWRKVPSADFKSYQLVNAEIVKSLQEQHLQRMKTRPALVRYGQYMDRVKRENNKTDWSLNLDERRQQYRQWKSYTEDYKAAQEKDIPALHSDEKRREDIKKRNAVIDNEEDKEIFVPDVGLYEGLNIFFNYIEKLTKTEHKNAA
ncbi:carboxy terminal-processing peptidase [Suttonella ornithocola]|uniref:Tail-specific protease n=1 Tax=Suttonella ornithocola TaxID=279832 RepID=A0A380MXS4_9GAMM|nr:carboxy terminal-processing peptidase [Suttonella ornithocola]SUO97004.1 Tail-specific protease precursor [Suttonella ornithocola]